ncbi:DUF1972 domain-containing protein [Seonamhaeicola sp. ML3]|uniref:DUF1972 domain-containing protein n=1 Tax=Seonamhaeicola sp. ML3 TaxID=2937786 RepID=UPI0020105DF4|nr:DUF1972 domain-containing protein [Seonamhaeicola sp. ML3]
MRIGIIGTRGIPNYHGGFEQFAEFFSVFLAERGHDVYVYNSSNHPYKDRYFKGVNIITCSDPENRIGTAGQFVYDFNCILDSRKRNFDIILQLGYTSSSVWSRLFPKSSVVITNMDGLEWRRSKYSEKVRRFLKYAEKLAVKFSDFLVADSIGIQNYIKRTYNLDSKFIAYGANVFLNPNMDILEKYNVKAFSYNLLIARFEPENNLETILDGVAGASKAETFLVIGKHDTNDFGRYLKEKFKNLRNIRFIGGVYNLEHLNNLRYFSNLYFHGHSVGGTNPSLLEAMASNTLIVAHDNEFNKSVIGSDGFFFNNSEEIKKILNEVRKENHHKKVENALETINNNYNWELINKSYLDFFNECLY